MININKFIFKIVLLALVLLAFTLFIYSYNNINKLYDLAKLSYINEKIAFEENSKIENSIYGYEIKFKIQDKLPYQIHVNNKIVDKDFNLANIKNKEIYTIEYIFENKELFKIKYTRKD